MSLTGNVVVRSNHRWTGVVLRDENAGARFAGAANGAPAAKLSPSEAERTHLDEFRHLASMEDLMAAVVSRVGIVTAVLLGVGVAAGCGGNTASSRPPVAPAPAGAGADEYASGLTEHHRYHHGGVTLFIAMSLDTLGGCTRAAGCY